MFKMDMGHPPEEAFKETELAVIFFEKYKCLDCSICNTLFGFQHRSEPIHLFCSHRCLAVGKYRIDCRPHNLELPEPVVSKPELVSRYQQTDDDWSSLSGQESVKIEKDDRKDEPLPLKFNSLWHQSVKIEKDDRKKEPLPSQSNSLSGQSVQIEKDDRKDEPLPYKFNSLWDQSAKIEKDYRKDEPLSSQSNSLDKYRMLGILRGNHGTKNIGPSQNLQLPSSVNKTNFKVETTTIKKELKDAADKISTSSNGSVSNVSLLINELEKKSSNEEVKISSKLCQGSPLKMNGIIPRAVLLASTKEYTPPPVKIQTPVLPVPVQEEKPKNVVPKLILIKRPGTATESSPVIEKPVADKKIWTIKDLSMSKSLVNSGPCTALHAWDIQKYHVQAITDQDKLSSLQDAIAEYSHEALVPTRVPSVNDILFAPYMDEYFRAKVTVPCTNLDDSLQVLFIDYGDEQKVKLSDCREPKDEIMRDNPMIYGVVFSLTFREEFPGHFNKDSIPPEVIYEDVTFMTVGKQLDDGFTGTLHLKNGKTMNDVIDDLIRKSRSSTKTWTIHNVKFSDKIKSGAVVLLNNFWNLGKMTLMAKDDILILENLQQKIQKFAAKAPSMSRTPQLNEIVIAPYHKLYYRGRVSKINGSNIQVVFIDHGDQATVKLSDIKETTDDIMKDPVYGICMQITGSPESPLPKNEKILVEVNRLTESGGVLSIESRDDPTLWTGQLRIGDNKTWSDFVKEVLTIKG